jgi:hypothetical protein
MARTGAEVEAIATKMEERIARKEWNEMPHSMEELGEQGGRWIRKVRKVPKM